MSVARPTPSRAGTITSRSISIAHPLLARRGRFGYILASLASRGWARSSAGEHYVDIVGVTGSIPVAPTIPRGLKFPLILDLHVLVGRERAHPHVGDRVFGDARADPVQRAQIHHRREHDPVDRQLLDLVEDLGALFS